MISSSLIALCTIIFSLMSIQSVTSLSVLQISTPEPPPWAGDHDHNELYRSTAGHVQPMKKSFDFDVKQHYYEPHHNNEKNGTYKCSSCPAVNTLANTDFIPRNGRNVTYQSIALAMRDVFNFSNDNVLGSISLLPFSPAKGLYRSC